MAGTWRNFKNIFSRPLFTIIFRPGMLKVHTYAILTGVTMVGFLIYCVLIQFVWQLQVIAEDSNSYRLSKETKMLIKNDNECNQHLHIIIGVTLSILVLLALLLLFAILFYLRKSPMEKIQRARSRIYSRLYSR